MPSGPILATLDRDFQAKNWATFFRTPETAASYGRAKHEIAEIAILQLLRNTDTFAEQAL